MKAMFVYFSKGANKNSINLKKKVTLIVCYKGPQLICSNIYTTVYVRTTFSLIPVFYLSFLNIR